MKPVRHIVMYIGSLQKGGAERVMSNLAECFFQQGFKVTLVTTYVAENEYELRHAAWHICEPGAEKDSAEKNSTEKDKAEKVYTVDEKSIVTIYTGTAIDGTADGIGRVVVTKAADDSRAAGTSKVADTSKKSGRLSRLYGRLKGLRTIWKQLDPDLILSFSGKNNIMAIITAFRLGIPVAVSVRSDPEREYPEGKIRFAMFMAFRQAACVILQTNAAMNSFPESIRKKACILPNSLNPDFIRPVFEGNRSRNVISVGRLDDNKDQQLLLRAFAGAAKDHEEYRLIIYGDGPDRDKLEELAGKLGIAQKTEFMGNVSNIADKIFDAGIFVLSSRQEGMPNALIEAMALGIPCISTDCPCGGPADLITDGENGLLTPVGDAAAMTKCLNQLMSEPDAADRMGRNASKVQKLYNPDIINARWQETLLSLMKGKR